ncbi:peptidoglycan DD-metalloendopeptidase family protein [Methylobacter sp. YRD-M1]|uniref:peptidoglycan DD-metalloendopeptidase family protein n=1 Tax=Methylobacter sp. YRD-M1 TaxID=2911520 RepID=UPI00227BA6C7|nr:peptidoglycan DD-metalloendopeptidase family protein [Methylobacter sp. YRD-M1]WAK00740.1 peptidoglycan DD-metalloendopeptidase family protein [Methylobacter sp. YRD-M1]
MQSRYAQPVLIARLMLVFLLNACSEQENSVPVKAYDIDSSENQTKPSENKIQARDNTKRITAGTKYYVVERGDTLYSIGLRSGHGYQRLAQWNRLPPPYVLVIGRKLKLFNSDRGYSTVAAMHPIKKNGRDSQKKLIFSDNSRIVVKLNWQWPIEGKVIKNFTQSNNKGIDISGKAGQAVSAVEAGKVAYSGKGLIGYDNLLIIKHNEMYLSAYANNNRLLVSEGQVIKKGQVIGYVGKTGPGQTSLHFEIRKNGKSVNPLNYLPKNNRQPVQASIK